MKRFYRFFEKFYDQKIDGIGLDIFRIFYGIVLFCEVSQIYYFRHLIFDIVPYIEPYEINFTIPLLIWLVCIFFLILGFKTKFFSVLNYIFTLFFLGTITSYEYHVFYAYLGINFLLIFTPISTCFSIDRILTKLKYSNTQFQYKPSKTVSRYFYILLPFVGVGLVYFDSIFYKFTSELWLNGLGVWKPSSSLQATYSKSSKALNSEWLMYFLGYLTILFELIFIFTFFRKKWRIPMLIIGIGLHIGILITFPIPWFALTAICLYILLVPVSFWRRLQYKREIPSLYFYYDQNCPLCIRTKIILSSLDWINCIKFVSLQSVINSEAYLQDVGEEKALQSIYSKDNKGNWYEGYSTYLQVFQRVFVLFPFYILGSLPILKSLGKNIYQYVAQNRTQEKCTEKTCGFEVPPLPTDDTKVIEGVSIADVKKFGYFILGFFLLALALNATYHSPLMNKGKKALKLSQYKPIQYLDLVSAQIGKYSKEFFGITGHGVFMDAHFEGYNHIIKVIYQDPNGKDRLLPITDEEGNPSEYIRGFNWVKYTFRVNGPKVYRSTLNKGVRDFTAFWAYQNGISLENATFRIEYKKIEEPKEWTKDFLEKQIAKPWLDGGYVEWKNEKFTSHIKDIEKL